MAKVLTGGHVARALEFYDQLENKEVYFVIGGSKEWTDAQSPDDVVDSVYSPKDIIGLKLPDNYHMVIEAEGNSDGELITYRDKNYKIVPARLQTNTSDSISLNSPTGTTIRVSSTAGFKKADNIKISWLSQVGNIGSWDNIEATISDIIDNSRMTITYSDSLSGSIPPGSVVLGGAIAEKAKYVYVDCYLQDTDSYTFPKTAYRQIGICTGVVPTAGHEADPVLTPGEYTSLGILEILDNRKAVHRDDDQREKLSLIIEF